MGDRRVVLDKARYVSSERRLISVGIRPVIILFPSTLSQTRPVSWNNSVGSSFSKLLRLKSSCFRFKSCPTCDSIEPSNKLPESRNALSRTAPPISAGRDPPMRLAERLIVCKFVKRNNSPGICPLKRLESKEISWRGVRRLSSLGTCKNHATALTIRFRLWSI